MTVIHGNIMHSLICLTFPHRSVSFLSTLFYLSLCLVGQHVRPPLHINCCLALSRNHSQLRLIRRVSVFFWIYVWVDVCVCGWVCVHQARVIPLLCLNRLCPRLQVAFCQMLLAFVLFQALLLSLVGCVNGVTVVILKTSCKYGRLEGCYVCCSSWDLCPVIGSISAV